jgi:hypothetical protein
MDVASVTLDEVLRAARARSASLVPETAGYLALAIGDASARLPYRIEDELVTLTTEGTVRVARGREGVSPEEGARVLREHLHRLLSVSAGSMPGLMQAGSARREVGGPDTVVAEIESALIPCNRAAARRSLARLARDTARARDAGRLAPNAPPLTRPGQHAPEARPTNRQRSPQASAPPAPQSHPQAFAQAYQPAAQPSYQAYAQPVAAYAPVAPPHAPAPQTNQAMQAMHPAYVPVAAAYAPAPQPTYAAPIAEAYAPAQAAPSAPYQEPAAHYPQAPSYAEIAAAPVAFEVEVEVDVDVDEPSYAEAQPTADEMTHRLDLAALGFEPSDATTIDSIEVIEATFQRIEAALLQDADATPRLGTGWPTNAPRPATFEGPSPTGLTPPGPGAEASAQGPRTRHPWFDNGLGAHVAAALASPAPTAVALAPRVDEAARALEAALESGRLATPRPRKAEAPLRMRRLPWQADLGRSRKSDVSELLARFGASDPQRDATAMRRDIKRTIGIDATQLPPRVATRER